MPPRKRARQSKPASTPSGNATEDAVDELPTPMELDSGKEDFVLDAWTDEQETSLFKSMIRWKPVGMHKHFRMIAISENLRNHGYTAAKDDHTRIPGIWEKLKGLYNLEALDERENDVGNFKSDENDPAKEPFYSFALPEEDYGKDMIARRIAPEGSMSPPALGHGSSGDSASGTRGQSTVDDTDGKPARICAQTRANYRPSDPKSSRKSTPGQGSVRGTRGRFTGNKSQLKEASTPVMVKGRPGKSKQNSKKGDQGREEADEDEMEDATPKTTTKSSTKASATTSNRRKSVRKR